MDLEPNGALQIKIPNVQELGIGILVPKIMKCWVSFSYLSIIYIELFFKKYFFQKSKNVMEMKNYVQKYSKEN